MLFLFSRCRLPGKLLPKLPQRVLLGERLDLNLAPALRPSELPQPPGDDPGPPTELLKKLRRHFPGVGRVDVLDVEQRARLAQSFTDCGGAVCSGREAQAVGQPFE